MKNKIRVLICLFLLAGTAVFAQNRHSSIAVTDSIELYPKIPDTLDILANDYIAPGDSIKWINVFGTSDISALQVSRGGFRFFVPHFNVHNLTDTLKYLIRFYNDTAVLEGKILCKIHDHSTEWLDTNEVRALICANGSHFSNEQAEYYVPKGSGITSIFSFEICLGGMDEEGKPHVTAADYRYEGRMFLRFSAGPVMDSGCYSVYQDNRWHRIWKIRKNEITEYKANWWNPWYTIPKDILEWPGNGDTTLGQAWQLAPFYDMNGDGVYDPLHGDCPEIRGDMCLYFIYNDDRSLYEGRKLDQMKLEIHGMAYAFDMPDDSAMKTATFINYRIFNRSSHTYDSTYIGFSGDPDLGCPVDDYVGCDVDRSLFYDYNGVPDDGYGSYPREYGANPPVQGFYIMGGPYMDPDGLDNPRYDESGHQLCGYSVNGRNFNDSIIDNERLGLTGFIDLNLLTINNSYLHYDSAIYRKYNLLKNNYGDMKPFFYGGNGRPQYGSYGPVARFMFPGNSDSINWNTDCVAVYPKNWTETSAGNFPYDRYCLGNSGPFTFHPGDVQEIDIAFVWARDYVNGTDGSIQKLQNYVDQINLAYTNNELSSGQSFYVISSQNKTSCRIFPNPAKDYMIIEFDRGIIPVSAEIISSGGICLKVYRITATKTTLDLTGIPAGLYVIKANTSSGTITKKIMVR